ITSSGTTTPLTTRSTRPRSCRWVRICRGGPLHTAGADKATGADKAIGGGSADGGPPPRASPPADPTDGLPPAGLHRPASLAGLTDHGSVWRWLVRRSSVWLVARSSRPTVASVLLEVGRQQ